jgi:hypothetical protein
MAVGFNNNTIQNDIDELKTIKKLLKSPSNHVSPSNPSSVAKRELSPEYSGVKKLASSAKPSLEPV